MNEKQIAATIALVFAIPFLIGLLIWVLNNAADPGNPENIVRGDELIGDAMIPWWVGVLEFLVNIPGVIGALLIIGFVIFLKRSGEIQ